MKKALAIAAIATLAASPAAATNLRAPASKTLLQRCAGNAKVEDCCPDVKGQHKLYQRKDDDNPGRLGKQCCSKSLGAWLPTNGDDVDKFCSLGKRTSDAEKSMDQVKSVSDRMANALTSLNAEKKDLKAQYRAAYIAHEKEENGERGEIEKDQKELQLMEDRNAQSKAKLNGLKDDLVQEQEKLQKAQQATDEKLEKLDADIDDQKEKFKSKQSSYAKMVSDISDATKELNSCKFESKEESKLINAIKGNIESCKKRQAEAKRTNQQYLTQAAASEAALVQAKKIAAKEKSEAVMALGKVKSSTKSLNTQMTALQEQIDSVETQLIVVDENIANQKKINKMKGISLVEVFGNDAEDRNGFDAKKYAAGKLEKKGKSWIDSEAAMLNDAQQFVKEKMSSMQKVLLNLKAVRSRVKALKKLDIQLNEQIMADLTKRHDKLAAAIKAANVEAVKLSNAIYGAGEVLRRAQKANRKATEQFRKQVTAKTLQLNVVARDLKEMTGLIFDAKIKLVALFAKNKVCAGMLKGKKIWKGLVQRNLDSERKELNELTATLENNKDKMERIKTELSTEQAGHEAEMSAITSQTGRLKDEYDLLKKRFNYKVDDLNKKYDEHEEKTEEYNKLVKKAVGKKNAFKKIE